MYGLILLFYLAITKALILDAAVQDLEDSSEDMRKPVNVTSRGRATGISLALGCKDGDGNGTRLLQTK